MMPYTIDRCPACGCEKWASIIPDAGPQLCHVCHAKEERAMTDTERDHTGYQPTGDRLDPTNPPRGGSGVQTSDQAPDILAAVERAWTTIDDRLEASQRDLDAALARAARAEEHWRQAEQAIDLVTAALTARAEAAEARVRELERVIEECDLAMMRLGPEGDNAFVALYQVAPGPWHRVLAVARGASMKGQP